MKLAGAPAIFPERVELERRKRVNLRLEREGDVNYEEINRSHVFIKLFEPFF